MMQFDVIEKLINLVPLNKEELLKLLQIEDNITVEIYGNYERFAIEQISEEAILYKIIKFVKGYKEYKKENEDRKFNTSSWILVCKKGYIKYLKELLTYFYKYFCKRSDLNFFTRLKMSILKSKRWVSRIVYTLDIEQFCECPEIFNKKICRLFENKEIDRIYIYKTVDISFINRCHFDARHKNKKGNT